MENPDTDILQLRSELANMRQVIEKRNIKEPHHWLRIGFLQMVILLLTIILVGVGTMLGYQQVQKGNTASAQTTVTNRYSETWTATNGIYGGSTSFYTYDVSYINGIPGNYTACAGYQTKSGVSCAFTVTQWSVTGQVGSP